MTFIDSIRVCFAKYADFHGRAGRPEFWWWTLFTLVASVALSVLNDYAALAFSLATFLPTLTVTTRRLHDTDKSGWWQLLWLVPFVGWAVLVFWCAQAGKASTRYA